MTRKQAGEYRAIIEQGAQLLEDGEALKVKTLYPEWEPGKDYPVGCKATYQGGLYKVLQAHTSQDSWHGKFVRAYRRDARRQQV